MNLVDRATNKFRRVFSIPEPYRTRPAFGGDGKSISVAAVDQRISSRHQIDFTAIQFEADGRDRRFWEADQNGACWSNTRRYATFFFCFLIMERSLK